jgi:hypothetical protein
MTDRTGPRQFRGRPATVALDYDIEPNAPSPTEWLTFLEGLWPNDPESVGLLQE